MSGLFAFPDRAAVNRLLPKTRLTEFLRQAGTGGRAPVRLRERLAAQVQDIVWAYKLAPETINLPAGSGAEEIQVFRVLLKGAELDHDLLRAVDRAVSFPVWFELHHARGEGADNGLIQPIAAPKRPHATDTARQVLGDYLTGAPQAASTTRAPLPPALNLGALHTAMLQSLIPLAPRPGEDLRSQLERLNELRGKQRELDRLEARLRREAQFNRKVALNRQVRALREALQALGAD
ncbi:DUF4391 domain-containing protein [uncultured Thiohalocapsa sp.]|uniref:DUF4391 domain-containing protein n=1 Tax=uncultured Thiohalocapsa sp. TaxID=768990 RepID=UPI0025F1B7F9|nr:DUF4391 domain-containing protein [uncultured Thiohalocapsa sp.]